MHDNRTIAEDRVTRAVRDRIEPALHSRWVPMGVEAWPVPGEPVPLDEALGATYGPLAVGDVWGPAWSTTWLRLTAVVPAGWEGETVEAVVDLGFDPSRAGFQAEGLAYSLTGEPIKGVAPRSTHVPLGRVGAGGGIAAGGPVGLLVEAAANPDLRPGGSFSPTPLGDRATAGDTPLYRLRRADLAVLDRDVFELAADVAVLDGLMRTLEPTDPRRHLLLRALERMVDVLDPDAVSATAAAARAELEEVGSRPAAASAHRVVAVGHAHIDSAWLWPVRETIRKTARTFSSAMRLMDDDPAFVFACSQAQQLAWVKEHHPAVFTRIREKVAAGGFAPVGGMWVEADSNMPGGEAMARQFVTGKAFLRDEFGVEPEEVWLPDSFGYSAGMPQIARLAGCRWFLTQKMSWNQTNRMPHHTFWWEGIDGTRVFTHFPPVDTYNSDLSARDLAHASAGFAEHGVATTSLVPFGWGNGGGGPTREMLAAAHRTADLEGSPRVRLGSSRDFFEAAEAEYASAPVWRGEMYLEMHRGTFTSQARTKRGNRTSEHLLREAELWAATAAVTRRAPYPYERLDELWKRVLLNQFHDILPGSSIAWVHREAEKAYAEVADALEGIIGVAIGELAGTGDAVLAFNAGPASRWGVEALGAGAPAAPTGAVGVEESGPGWVVDNGAMRVVVDRRGLLVSVLDRVGRRELVPAGEAANLLQLHTDTPNRWDAWDIDEHYRRVRSDLTDADVVEPVPGGVRVRRTFGSSSVDQVITLPAVGDDEDGRHVDITTDVDWHERKKLLKAAFPLDLHAERFASETQFGHVWRPTHTNTSWDAARFEVCAHRWIHVEEPGYGVGIANDGTYGHDVTRTTRPGGGTTTVARLSLLRAPTYPDPDADQGHHRFRISLVAGGLDATVAAGYDLNLPRRVTTGTGPVAPLVTVDHRAVVVEAVKLAEDRSGDLVVRLYESLGGRAAARVGVACPVTSTVEADLLERPRTDGTAVGTWDGAGFDVTLRPFEVVTVRIGRPPGGTAPG